MRSSVSYMLSHGSGEPAMSHPDYDQQAHHHSCLLVLIRGIGTSKPRSLQKIFERIQHINNVKIKDSAGYTRDIWVRYVRDHPVENNEWGDFQTHRRLLGLITVGKFDSQSELNEMCRVHESLKVKYTNTLFDSRCFMFAPNAETNNENSDIEPDEPILRISNGDITLSESNNDNTQTNNGSERAQRPQNFVTPPNFKSNVTFYVENSACIDLEEKITDFVSSLFWILEKKRLERSHEKLDKLPLLLAPFEKKDFVGLDMDTRNMRKRCVGRVTKNLADLTLQAGLVAESLNLFHSACETLRAISDSLWLGAANEGLCAASATLLYPHIRYYTMSFQRNASLQENSTQKLSIHRATSQSQENLSDSKILINRKSNLVINLGTNSTLTNPMLLTNSSSTSGASSGTSSVSGGSSNASSPSSTVSNQVITGDKNQLNSNPPNVLQSTDFVMKYREAIINYSKYRHAGIIETEAALKAARICIEQNRYLDVAVFLQNVLYINLNMTEQERVQRFEILTELYQRIGFVRKAAFCQRLAAWRHVAQSNTNPDWNKSYRLMLDSFPGHKLSLDPLEVIENNAGWKVLQIDLLQQLVAAARRIGHSALATRHLQFLLQTMWPHLTSTEQKDLSFQLQSLSSQCEGAPVPLVLEDGTVIPPSNLTDLPCCEQFKIKNLPAHLRPTKLNIPKADTGPFLFTPIHFNSIDRRIKKNDGKITFQWVQNEMCDVSITLKNPLPYELKISDMRLLTNGIVFESVPETVVLPPLSPSTVTLRGIPIENGSLEILGYSTHTLGVKSNCRLKHMNQNRERLSKFPPLFNVDVIPALPNLEIKTSCPPMDTLACITNTDNVITSTNISLYCGETTECVLTLTNISPTPIEFLEESIHSSLDSKTQNLVFTWSSAEIQSQMPLKPHQSLTIHLKIVGYADFLGPINMGSAINGGTSFLYSHHTPNNHMGNELNSITGGMSAFSVSGHASLPSRMGSPINVARRNEFTTASFRSKTRSSTSGHSSLVTYSQTASGANSRQLEAQFRFRYSGGDGLKENHARNCSLLFNMEFMPSVQITNWDVLPAETSSQFYLVLDVTNMTAQEMMLNYTQNKNIVIEAKENCRVPVPIERCPLFRNGQRDSSIEDKDNLDYIVPKSEAELTQLACSKHISDSVQLNWSLLNTDIKGTAFLRGITLSSAMLSIITVAPLKWDVEINKKMLPALSELSCSTGQSIPLRVDITNQSPIVLSDLVLSIELYQDYQNGTTKYQLETRVAISGPNRIHIKSLQTNEFFSHECSVIFFTAGRFKTSIQCSHSGPLTADEHHSLNALAHNYALNMDGNQLDSQTWQYMPAPEITVVEQI